MSVYNDMNCNFPNRKGDRVLFHKVIFSTYDDAVNALKVKNLAPGEIAVARYYVDYNTDTIPPTWSAVRMVMAIGGATPHSGHDTYIFNDSVSSNDTDFITGSELNSILSNYYNREEIEEMIDNISVPEIDIENLATKDDINDVKSQITGVSEAVSDIQKTKADVSAIEDVSNRLSEKADIETVNKISDELNNKVDTSTLNSTVENLVSDALENSSTITNAVNSAIESADIPGQVTSAVEGMDLVSNEKFDASLSEKANTADVYTKEEIDEIIDNIDIPEVDLSNYYTKDEVYTRSEVEELIPDVSNFVTNEQLTTEVQNQIESSEIIKELQTKVETLDHLDGEELDTWYLTFASSEDDINTAIINNENDNSYTVIPE